MEKKLAQDIVQIEGLSNMSLGQYSENEIGLVINASPLGLIDEPAPDWLNQLINNLADDCLCFDLVYSKNKSKPMFTQLAKDRGLQAIDGLSMLVQQARFAFEYWTGVNVPSEVLYKAIS